MANLSMLAKTNQVKEWGEIGKRLEDFKKVGTQKPIPLIFFKKAATRSLLQQEGFKEPTQ